MARSQLLLDIVEQSEEVQSHNMESSSGSAFITSGGVYNTTIEKAFISRTKKKGLQLDIFFGGATRYDTTLYIASNKNGKLITTCEMQGKTVSLPDYKMFLQLYYVATGKGLNLSEMEVEVGDVKFKRFGKETTIEAETITAMIGMEVNIGVKLEASYAYDADTKSEDKTQYRVDNNGDTSYSKNLESVFSKDGFSAQEIIKKEDTPKAMESKKNYLESDKSIYHPKLEVVEFVETVEEEVEEIDF